MKGVARVLLIDADALTPAQVLPLLGAKDYVLVAGNTQQEMARWNTLAGCVKALKVNKVPIRRQAADLALAFSAGEVLGKAPQLQRVPWIIVSHDQDFDGVSCMLRQRHITSVLQIAIKASPNVAPATSPQQTAKNSEYAALRRTLDSAIKKNGGYPCSLSQVPALLKKSEATINDPRIYAYFSQQKLRKGLVELGFECDSQFVTRCQA